MPPPVAGGSGGCGAAPCPLLGPVLAPLAAAAAAGAPPPAPLVADGSTAGCLTMPAAAAITAVEGSATAVIMIGVAGADTAGSAPQCSPTPPLAPDESGGMPTEPVEGSRLAVASDPPDNGGVGIADPGAKTLVAMGSASGAHRDVDTGNGVPPLVAVVAVPGCSGSGAKPARALPNAPPPPLALARLVPVCACGGEPARAGDSGAA